MKKAAVAAKAPKVEPFRPTRPRAHVTVSTLGGSCANTFCTNQVGEGHFKAVAVRTNRNVGNGTGIIQIALCSPCATALAEVANREG